MFDQILFKNKTFSDILEEIYKDNKAKEKQINNLICELKPLVTDPGNAVLIVPLIKEYLEIGVKNSDNLIKMAGICQRMLTRQNDSSSEFIISDDEREELLSTINAIEKETKELPQSQKVIKV